MSLGELLNKLRFYFAYIRSKWRLLIIVGVFGAALGILYAFLDTPRYKGELSFVLSGGSASGGLAGLAGQFGLDLGSSSSEGAFQGDNIVELLKSRKIVRRALFRTVQDSSDVLANLIARESGLAKKWMKKEYLRQSFPFARSEFKQTPVQDSLLRELHTFISDKSLVIKKNDKKLSFYNVSATSSSEIFSVFFTRSLVNEAIQFYIETKTKTAKDNLNMLQHEADSLRFLLGGAVGSVASATDETFNLNSALQVNRTSLQKSQIQVEVLGTAYGEVVKNLEIAKITLQKETPLVQVIDEPGLPLKVDKTGKLKGAVTGFLLFVLVTAGVLAVMKLYKNLFTNRLG